MAGRNRPILEDDKRLKEERAFTGGYTMVKDYVRSAELHSREMFIPLTHAPGEAQADFGEALVAIAGVEQKAHSAPPSKCPVSSLRALDRCASSAVARSSAIAPAA
jgi:hypothetical protein